MNFDLQSAEHIVLIGNREWMSRNGVNVPRPVQKALSQHEELGYTAVLAAIDGKCGYWEVRTVSGLTPP